MDPLWKNNNSLLLFILEMLHDQTFSRHRNFGHFLKYLLIRVTPNMSLLSVYTPVGSRVAPLPQVTDLYCMSSFSGPAFLSNK